MNIVFFGTPEFSVQSLESLNKIPQINILSVITQPDKKVGRKGILTPPPVKICAQNLGLLVHQPKTKEEVFKIVKKYTADFFVVIAYGSILDKKTLELPKYGAVNVHGSLLPKYRGASPIQEALLNGDKETGLSIMAMNEKMDEGDVYFLKRVEIAKEDNYQSLSDKLAIVSANILPFLLEDIALGKLDRLKQDPKQATFCRKIEKEDGKINFKTFTAEKILNMIRAYTPWPTVYADIKGKKIQIIEAEEISGNLKPNEIKVENKILKIGTKKGVLMPLKVKLEGKSEMDIKSFLNGYQNLFN